MTYDLEHFACINDSLYLSKYGWEAAIVNGAGAGILEVGVSKTDRDFRNLLRFSALGTITQNPQTRLSFKDHFHYGGLLKNCFGGATYNYYHFNDAVPITEEHLKKYATLYQTVAADNPGDAAKTVQGKFKSLKDLSLSLHRLAMVVAMDYIDRDTWAAKLPIIGGDARLRRDSADLATGVFDDSSHYFIADYKTDFKNGTIEKEAYSRKEKQLQLFEPRASI
ncbi:MAG: hypothetical protein Q7S55_01420 [Nanoarchaeota archaeon]|nr:hypothetical protein [Nanoarchaeota archaeon]